MKLPLRFEPTQTPNLSQITVGELTLFYSYHTLIAFVHERKVHAIHSKDFTRTTLKHVKVIEPDYNAGLTTEDFTQKLNAALKVECAKIAKG